MEPKWNLMHKLSEVIPFPISCTRKYINYVFNSCTVYSTTFICAVHCTFLKTGLVLLELK